MEAFPSNANEPEPKQYNKVKPTSENDAPDIETGDERPRVGKIVSNGAVRRKTPLGKRVKNLFLSDAGQGVWEFVVHEVLVPAAKDMFTDAVNQGLEKKLYGEVRSVGRRTGVRPGAHVVSNTNVGTVRYDRASSSPVAGSRSTDGGMSRRARQRHDFGEIVVPTRGEATEVIDMMFAIISKYEQVSVAEFYEMVNITPSHTDYKYGWTDIRGAGVVRVNGGYLIDLPVPVALD